MIRRGIPYGQPFDPANEDGGGPDEACGLVFVCYQADLVSQFEFVQADWVNDPDFPHDRPNRPGPDPVVSGRLSDVNDGQGSFESRNAAGERQTTKLHFRPFVRTEGSVHAFMPSLSTLRRLTQGRLDGDVPGPKPPDVPARPVDALIPYPGHPGQYFAFQGGTVRTVTSAGGAATAINTAPDRPLSSWPGLRGIGRVDAVIPVPDRQGATGSNDHWVFFTGTDGKQRFRYVTVADRDTPESAVQGGEARELGKWRSFTTGGPRPVTHVDAVVPIPDKQPGGDGRYYFWLFHTTPEGQRYRIISIAAGPGARTDHMESDDSRLSAWNSLPGVDRVDAVQPVPGRQRVNGVDLPPGPLPRHQRRRRPRPPRHPRPGGPPDHGLVDPPPTRPTPHRGSAATIARRALARRVPAGMSNAAVPDRRESEGSTSQDSRSVPS